MIVTHALVRIWRYVLQEKFLGESGFETGIKESIVSINVEINGIWGEVKKINFRSTVVQTFDNASLIIPNSEFISNQVINWSFKDKSLRIKIVVGVAYGTDIELVREVLLEIARRMPNVRTFPEPDALFKDFGDSALMFTLRVWTDIDEMLTTASAIRFEIDKAFKEKDIGILSRSGIFISDPSQIRYRWNRSRTQRSRKTAETRKWKGLGETGGV